MNPAVFWREIPNPAFSCIRRCGRLFGLVLLAALVSVAGLAAPAWPDSGGEVCVAWEARKTVFLMSDETAMGISCEGTLRTEWTETGQTVFRFLVAPNTFVSGEPDRDEEVGKLLARGESPEIQFVSDSVENHVWKMALLAQKGELKGNLTVAGVTLPVVLSFRIKDGFAVGSLAADFPQFKLDPPTVGWGAVAKVHDALKLHFRVSEMLIHVP